MSGPSSIIKKNISSIMTLLIGMFIFLSIPGQIAIDEGSMSGFNARTLPYFIASAIIVLSLLIIVSDVIGRRKKGEDSSVNTREEATSYLRVFLAFLSITFWILFLPYLGFNLTTILLIASIMLLIGNCRWWQIAVLSFILSVPLNFLLKIVLRVYLPQGNFFN